MSARCAAAASGTHSAATATVCRPAEARKQRWPAPPVTMVMLLREFCFSSGSTVLVKTKCVATWLASTALSSASGWLVV